MLFLPKILSSSNQESPALLISYTKTITKKRFPGLQQKYPLVLIRSCFRGTIFEKLHFTYIVDTCFYPVSTVISVTPPLFKNIASTQYIEMDE